MLCLMLFLKYLIIGNGIPKHPEWITRGKRIKELEYFGDQNLFVEISFDGGDTSMPISLVGKIDGKCVLSNYENSTE